MTASNSDNKYIDNLLNTMSIEDAKDTFMERDRARAGEQLVAVEAVPDVGE